MSKPPKKTKFYDTVIIGYGPTGATLVNLLGLCGLNVLVLERSAQLYQLPRAVHFDDETMRVFQTIGIADELTKLIRINLGMRFVDPQGKLLLDWPRPQGIGPNRWHASYRFHQPDLERVLRKATEHNETLEIHSSAEVFFAHDQGDKVEVRYKDLKTGQIHIVNTKYAVGCDGANSIMRQFIGTEMNDLGFQERWLVIDVLLKTPMPELGDHTIQYCNPKRPATYCRNPGKRRRWEIRLMDYEDETEATKEENVWAMLKNWISPNEANLERKVVYTFLSAIAEKWRSGRLLLAGDAAHLTPPFMGQGLCAGIRDVANLAWKLALCSKGEMDDSLLDTYHSERYPHVKAYIETAIQLGGLINNLDSAEALKTAFPKANGSARMESIAPRLGDGLKAGSSAHRGKLFPQLKLTGSLLMDDVIGYSPVLMIRNHFLNCNHQISTNSNVISAISEPEVEACLEELDTNAVLVRPDRYVLGTAKTEKELNELLAFKLPPPMSAKWSDRTLSQHIHRAG